MSVTRSRVIAVGPAITLECGVCMVTYYVTPFATVEMLVNAEAIHNEEYHVARIKTPPTEGGG